MLEFGNTIHKENMLQLAKEPERQRNNPDKLSYWNVIPTSKYVGKMLKPNFSLIDLPLENYQYENLELYQYYINVGD